MKIGFAFGVVQRRMSRKVRVSFDVSLLARSGKRGHGSQI
ncbi:unnamed protein product [Arabidopsis halleri]